MKTFNLEVGDEKTQTIGVEDEKQSSIFWTDYFTNSYLNTDDGFVIDSSVDLMGNKIN